MKNECSIIKDLLPLYIEGMVSEDTKKFIEEHMKNCDQCSAELKSLNKIEIKQDVSMAKPIKELKNRLLSKKITTVILTILITIALGIVVFTGLLTPKYFPYSEDLISVTDNEDGTITVKLFEPITDYNYNVINDPDSGKDMYFIDAWTTVLNKLTTDSAHRTLEFKIDNEDFLVFYSQYNGEDDVLVYGDAPEDFGGVITLPRLYLNTYFIMAIALFIALVLLSIILEKKFGKTTLVKVINIVIPIPISYAIAHICSVIVGWSPYSHGIYFISNLSLTVIIYFIQMLIIKMVMIKKENQEIK